MLTSRGGHPQTDGVEEGVKWLNRRIEVLAWRICVELWISSDDAVFCKMSVLTGPRAGLIWKMRKTNYGRLSFHVLRSSSNHIAPPSLGSIMCVMSGPEVVPPPRHVLLAIWSRRALLRPKNATKILVVRALLLPVVVVVVVVTNEDGSWARTQPTEAVAT